jgi:large subunit ribosomal protein L7/L12
MAKITKEQFIESLKEMTLLEINDLVKEIETTFGVSAAAPTAVAATGPVAPVEKPTSVTISLVEIGANKVAVIKTYREVTGLGLMEAKAAVEKAPVVIKENIKPEEAEEIKKKFETAGSKIKVE